MSAWNMISEAPSLLTEGPQSLWGACCSVYSHDWCLSHPGDSGFDHLPCKDTFIWQAATSWMTRSTTALERHGLAVNMMMLGRHLDSMIFSNLSDFVIPWFCNSMILWHAILTAQTELGKSKNEMALYQRTFCINGRWIWSVSTANIIHLHALKSHEEPRDASYICFGTQVCLQPLSAISWTKTDENI